MRRVEETYATVWLNLNSFGRQGIGGGVGSPEEVSKYEAYVCIRKPSLIVGYGEKKPRYDLVT